MTSDDGSARATKRWPLWAPVIVSLLCSLVFVARTAFTVNGEIYFTLFDDAMISMRYARNLAEGHGLRWNVGQPAVEGYTNFLWTLWMAALHLLQISASKMSLMVMLTGALILATNLLVVQRIATHLAPNAPLAASLSVWLTALYYPLIYWTLRGMEVGLVTLIISTSMLVALRLRDRIRYRELLALAALLALGILARPDVVVPCLVISGFAFSNASKESRSTVALVLVGTIVGTLAIHTIFRMLYYGVPLPNTYYLKVAGAPLGARFYRGLIGLLVLDLLHFIVPVALALSCVVALARTSLARSGAFLLFTTFVALCAYSVYVGGDVWDNLQYANRYVTPAMPGLFVLSAIAIDRLLSTHARPSRGTIVGVACLFVLGSLLAAISPIAIDELLVTSLDERLRVARVALALTPILVLPLLFLPAASPDRQFTWLGTPSRRRSIVAVALAFASWTAVNGQAVSRWIGHNAAYANDDEWAVRYGLALRAATGADATIAVSWAGAIPYFSHRPTIDLLGKSDRTIAARDRQPAIGFLPGHDKWDYSYSIGELRPDVVAELWHASDADFRAIESWGYIRLAPWVFARADSTRIDRAALQEAACVILAEDPLVLGSVRRSVASLDELRARYCR